MSDAEVAGPLQLDFLQGFYHLLQPFALNLFIDINHGLNTVSQSKAFGNMLFRRLKLCRQVHIFNCGIIFSRL